MKRIFFVMLIVMLFGCGTYYSTMTRPESENIINAPIDIVWEKVLQILPTEDITIRIADKNSHSILGRKGMSMSSIADDIAIQLIPKGEHQTIMNFSCQSKNAGYDWGNSERVTLSFFNKVKEASE